MDFFAHTDDNLEEYFSFCVVVKQRHIKNPLEHPRWISKYASGEVFIYVVQFLPVLHFDFYISYAFLSFSPLLHSLCHSEANDGKHEKQGNNDTQWVNSFMTEGSII